MTRNQTAGVTCPICKAGVAGDGTPLPCIDVTGRRLPVGAEHVERTETTPEADRAQATVHGTALWVEDDEYGDPTVWTGTPDHRITVVRRRDLAWPASWDALTTHLAPATSAASAPDDGSTDAATCTHGLLVGLHHTDDPRECQVCDWCPRCQSVQEWADEDCLGCGLTWGEHPAYAVMTQ